MPNEQTPLEKRLSFTPWQTAQFTGIYQAYCEINPLATSDLNVYIDYTERFLKLHRKHIIPFPTRSRKEQMLIINELVSRSFLPEEVALEGISLVSLTLLTAKLYYVDGLIAVTH